MTGDLFQACVCVVYLCSIAQFCDACTNGDGNDCVSGFMSLERMDALLGSMGDAIPGDSLQGIFTEVGFMCSGSIRSWVVGADWVGQNSYPELQIWRPTGTGVYTKVGHSAIIAKKQALIYEYRLPSPLVFEAGDVLGYYQPHPSQSQLRVLLERHGREPQRGYYYSMTSPASLLNTSSMSSSDDRFQILVYAVTDPPGCGCGFMSVERMRYLLGVNSVAGLILTSERQQITPEMKFTCDGVITRWIIGANFNREETLYPEIEVWRNIGNGTYKKINGMLIEFQTSVTRSIYEYDGFTPVPVKSGDILGIFVPRYSSSRLHLLSETATRPTHYYLSTESSVYNEIDIQQSDVTKGTYHPLLSVEFVRDPTPTKTTSILPSTGIGTPKSSSLADVKPTAPGPTQTSVGTGITAIGVGGVFVVLVATALTLTCVTVGLRQRSNKTLPITANEAYGISLELKENTSTAARDSTMDDEGLYDYVDAATPNNVPVSVNEAYGLVQIL